MFRRIKNALQAGKERRQASVSLSPVSIEKGAAAKQRGEAFLKTGELASAASAFAQSLQFDPHNVETLVALAYVLREQGRLDEAAARLAAAVALDPDRADAHYMLGLISQADNRLAEAIGHFRRVTVLNPEAADVFRDLCRLCFQCGQIDEAKRVVALGLERHPDFADLHYFLGNLQVHEHQPELAIESFGRALALHPDYPEVHYNCAVALHGLGRLAEALSNYEAALSARPDYLAALVGQGNALRTLGRNVEAKQSYDRALAADGGLADVHNNMGLTLEALGRYEDALISFERAVALKPAWPEALINQGNLLRDLHRPEAALRAYRQVLAEHPQHPELLNNCGLLLLDLKRADEAIECYDGALRARPDFAAALNNRGLALQERGRFDDALADFDRAIEIDKHLADAHANRGNVLQELVRHREALASYEAALRIRPDFEGIYLNQSLSWLVLGDLRLGWPKYEWRWKSKQRTQSMREFSVPLWSGKESLREKTILLHAEQGLGDTIQFCRYARVLQEQGATVLLEVQPPLRSLLLGVQGASRVFSSGEASPPFDYHCPLLSLPLACDTDLLTIPSSQGYLGLDAEFARRSQVWHGRLGPAARPRIGLVWSGNPNHKNDGNRSIPLADFSRILSGQAEYFCLQNEVRDADREALAAHPEVRYVGDDLRDFSDTAALIANLDLVISIDTSVAHLAGALGKPLWLLLPANPDWRWLLDRDDSPWYESARLFRQRGPGHWEDVLFTIRDELGQFAS
jgi:tetratricopeptide (TPR) repeat protein